MTMLSPNENRWDDLIVGPAALYNVPVAVIKAVIWNESRFAWPVPDRQEPRLNTASIGVMQILPETALWVECRWAHEKPAMTAALRVPGENIRIGTHILGMYMNGWRPGSPATSCDVVPYAGGPFSVDDTFAAYNGGEGVIHNPGPQVQAYVASALKAYTYFSQFADAGPMPPDPGTGTSDPFGGGPDASAPVADASGSAMPAPETPVSDAGFSSSLPDLGTHIAGHTVDAFVGAAGLAIAGLLFYFFTRRRK